MRVDQDPRSSPWKKALPARRLAGDECEFDSPPEPHERVHNDFGTSHVRAGVRSPDPRGSCGNEAMKEIAGILARYSDAEFQSASEALAASDLWEAEWIGAPIWICSCVKKGELDWRCEKYHPGAPRTSRANLLAASVHLSSIRAWMELSKERVQKVYSQTGISLGVSGDAGNPPRLFVASRSILVRARKTRSNASQMHPLCESWNRLREFKSRGDCPEELLGLWDLRDTSPIVPISLETMNKIDTLVLGIPSEGCRELLEAEDLKYTLRGAEPFLDGEVGWRGLFKGLYDSFRSEDWDRTVRSSISIAAHKAARRAS